MSFAKPLEAFFCLRRHEHLQYSRTNRKQPCACYTSQETDSSEIGLVVLKDLTSSDSSVHYAREKYSTSKHRSLPTVPSLVIERANGSDGGWGDGKL